MTLSTQTLPRKEIKADNSCDCSEAAILKWKDNNNSNNNNKANILECFPSKQKFYKSVLATKGRNLTFSLILF